MSDKFSGFMISSQGIEINLDKREALKMEEPRCIRDIQNLYSQLAVLGHFLSK